MAECIDQVKNSVDGNSANSNSKRKNSEGSPNSVRKKLKLEENEKDLKADSSSCDVLKGGKETNDNCATQTRCRRKLTAENVKTILRYVLANEPILAMVQKTMKLQKKRQKMVENEGRLTRSKTKEFNKPPWPPVTPAKNNEEETIKLLEEEYSEESASDEDYQPNYEELSDEDVASSVKVDDLNTSIIDKPIPPDPKTIDSVSDDEGALVIALPENKDVPKEKESDKIAQRTRSKLCLNDTPLEKIEESFMPPDITVDMYNTEWDDVQWQEFLCELTKPIDQASNIENVPDDAEDDPEYKVQEEPPLGIEEYYDTYGEESPEEVAISEDELKTLMTEILEFAQQDYSFLDDLSFLEEHNLFPTEKAPNKSEHSSNPEMQSEISDSTLDTKTVDNTSNSENNLNVTCTPVQEEIVRKEWMIPDERFQLDEQMRMYVQLLTQTYLLSHGNPSLHFINETSKLFLKEIYMFATREIAIKQRSAFYAHNLDGAMDILNKYEDLPVDDKKKEKKTIFKKGVPRLIKKTLAASKVFIYPELLPKCGFREIFHKPGKIKYSVAENNLVALGLEQFADTDDPVQHIHDLLLPMKPKNNLKAHISRATQKEVSLRNPIGYYAKLKKLIPFKRVIRVFDPDNIKAPEEYPPAILPLWMKSFSKYVDPLEKEREKIPQEKKLPFILPRAVTTVTMPQNLVCDPPIVLRQLKAKPLPPNVKDTPVPGSSIILPKWITRNRKRKPTTRSRVKNDKCVQVSRPSSVASSVTSSVASSVASSVVSSVASSVASSDSHTSMQIKEEPQSPRNSNDDSSEDESQSDTSFGTDSNDVKHSKIESDVNANLKTIQNKMCVSKLETLSNSYVIDSVKVEPSSPTNSYDETTSVISESHSAKEFNHYLQDYSLTEPSLKIDIPQDQEFQNGQTSASCDEPSITSSNTLCDVFEDAVLPPATDSAKKKIPPDFSAIRDIIQLNGKECSLDMFINESSLKKSSQSKNWSLKDDQMIIDNCKSYGINENAFQKSASLTKSTADEVKQRFLYLLKSFSLKLKIDKDL